MIHQRVRVIDPALWLALAAALPATLLIAAGTSLAWQPHWPGLRTLLIGVVIAPVLEEIVFRGGLQEWLIRRWRDRPGTRHIVSVANLAASAIFALAHLIQHPPLWAAGMFGSSLVFGALYDRQRRLEPPIIVHSVYNLGYLVLLVGS